MRLLHDPLSETPEATTNRLCGLFKGDPAHVVIYGAGKLGRETAAGLRANGFAPLALVDSNPLRWGETVEGTPVVSPADAIARWGEDASFVVAVSQGASLRQELEERGVRNVVPYPHLWWRFPETFLPLHGLCFPDDTLAHAGEIRRVEGLWADEASRAAYRAQVEFRLTLDYGVLPTPSPAEETYFIPEIGSLPPGGEGPGVRGTETIVDCGLGIAGPHNPQSAIHNRLGETFVDVGAFDGDTLTEFFARYPEGRAVALEPDPHHWNALVAGFGERAALYAFAAASESGTLAFHADGSPGASVRPDGALRVRAVRLDDLLRYEAPTFLKFDVEGAELDALKGALETIRAHRPVLAVCLYHKPEDLWEIPLLIDALGLDYRLLFRAHAEECWETVLYAVPADRYRP